MSIDTVQMHSNKSVYKSENCMYKKVYIIKK